MIIGVLVLLALGLCFLYRCNIVFYAPEHCIQRLFGYRDFYDRLADVFLRIHNRTIYYTYQNKEWRLEFWKGRYWAFIGGEIGIYNKKTENSKQHYNAAKGEELIYMSMELYHNEELLLTRPYKRYWWINGFRLLFSKRFSRDSLRLHATLTFNDFESRDAFISAYIKQYDSKTIRVSPENQNLTVEVNF